MSAINKSIFKAYDIRGIYPSDINEKNFSRIIEAIYSFFVEDCKRQNLKIVLSRDMRLSSPILFDIAEKSLVDLGARVIDIGLSSTPTFYFAVLKYRGDCGIQISASHNPPNWNGVKFIKRIGNKLVKIGRNTGMNRVAKLAESKRFAKSEKKGEIKQITTAVKDEVDFAFRLLAPRQIKKIKVVADPANAMGITYLQELFKRLPCSLVRMNFTLDGSFPAHQPDPLNFKNLVDLEKKVIEEKADLGIAPDGDGDRVFFINEKGRVIPASLISSLITTELLKVHKGDKIGLDVRYTRNISSAVKKAGGKPIIGPVGHALISELMKKEDILFTGESSGHFFYRDTGYAESSVITILMVLDVISRKNKPISEIVSHYATSIESGESNYILPQTVQAENLFKKIASEYKEGKISWLDGLSINFPSWRFSLRASNTEPLVRLNLEGETSDLVDQKVKEVQQKLFDNGAKLKD